jgi:hypothetical protein
VLPGLNPKQHLKEIKRVWYAVRHAMLGQQGEVALSAIRSDEIGSNSGIAEVAGNMLPDASRRVVPPIMAC